MKKITKSPARKDRFIWLDALRLLAGLSMVGLHASSNAAGLAFPDVTPGERVIPMLFRAIVYMARTELFIIISLFLLILSLERRPRGYRDVIAEQSRRLLIPFLFWTVFFASWSLLKANHYGYLESRIDALTSPLAWAEFLLLGDVKYHMHFLPTLFGVLLFFPIYRLGLRYPWLAGVLVICLLSRREVDIYLWGHFSDAAWFEFALRFIKIASYAGYGLFAGALIAIYRKLPKPAECISWLQLIGLLVFLLFALKLVQTAKVIEIGRWQYNYLPAYLSDALMPCLLFLAAMLASYKTWPKWFSKAAPFSFGIYLCHPIFIDIYEMLTRGLEFSPTVLVMSKVAFALCCTIPFVFALSRIRQLAWVIGLGPLPQLSLRGVSKNIKIKET